MLVAPTTPTPAWAFDATDVTLNGIAEPYRTSGLRLTVPFTALGGPSLSVPCGFSAAGLPIGLQIAGRSLDEAACSASAMRSAGHGLAPRQPAALDD